MGQQQLLLLVLGIVIVGLAVVVGIQAFGENQRKANADALVNDGVRIASDAQAWSLKPEAFGGGGGSFDGITFESLGYRADTDGNYVNLNGVFQLSDITDTGLTITGCSAPNENLVTVVVDGTFAENVNTTVATAESCPE